MPRGPAPFVLLLLLIVNLLAGCGEGVGPTPASDAEVRESPPVAVPGPAALTVDQPRDGAVFPPGFVPPTFSWHDDTPGVVDSGERLAEKPQGLVPGILSKAIVERAKAHQIQK